MRKRFISFLSGLIITITAIAQGWPESYGGVMLQGFYWDSYSDTKWTNLTSEADELSKYFDLIWVPQSGMTSTYYHSKANSMGYDPCFWFNQNSCFGTDDELRTMIQTYKAHGTGIIADVVINHKNGLNDWCDFPEEEWNGNKITWSLADICSNDEASQHGYAVTGRHDEGDNFDGYRDLDHTSANVQKNVKLYEDFLLNDMGYTGFRYDMVKGFAAYYVGMYNASSQPKYSVGEYWDGSYDNVAGWVKGKDGTSNFNGTVESAAFDFPMKFGAINGAFGSNNFKNGCALSNKGLAGDNVNGMNRYSVTFVDNHDTYRDANKLSNNVLAANAFILAMPGTPCIFLPHWKSYKAELEKMIMARKAAGITNTSSVTKESYDDDNDGYYATVGGSNGSVLIIAGYVTGANTNGYTLISSGNSTNPNYAFYLSNNCVGKYNSYMQGTTNPTADRDLINASKKSYLFDRVFKKGIASTVCLPFNLSTDELSAISGKLYAFTDEKDGNLIFSPVTKAEAFEPYVFISSSDKADYKPFNLPSKTWLEGQPIEVTHNDFTFVGASESATILSDNSTTYYGYIASTGQFIKIGKKNGARVKPSICYFSTSATSQSTAKCMVFSSTPAAITEVSTQPALRRDNAIYNLAGQRVSASYKGIVIINGKKLIRR